METTAKFPEIQADGQAAADDKQDQKPKQKLIFTRG